MIRLITVGACALALVACQAETPEDPGSNTPNATAIATDANCKVVLEEEEI